MIIKGGIMKKYMVAIMLYYTHAGIYTHTFTCIHTAAVWYMRTKATRTFSICVIVTTIAFVFERQCKMSYS